MEKSASILIVDDEATIRRLLIRLLTKAGYECQEADSTESAKEMLATKSFDLLLSDIKMPGESGVELIRYAKEHYPETGRVMITGYGSPEVSNEIIQIGVYGYIIKPVTKNEVLITVETALQHLRLDRHMIAYKVELEKKISGQIEKNSAIMNNLSVGVVMFDRQMSFLEFNRKMHQWFPEIGIGKTIPCYRADHCSENDDQCNNCPMLATFRTGSAGETERNIVTVQGEREFRIVTSPVFDKHGIVYAGIALYEDITEKKLLERDLHQAQKLEAVGQLAAGIAHELNSPIQYIGDNIRFLKDSLEDITSTLNTYDHFWRELVDNRVIPEEMSRSMAKTRDDAEIDYLLEEIPKTLDQSLEGVHRVEKIVRAMKDFSHPGDEEKTPANINTILQTTATICRNEWKYVAELETDLAADLPLVLCYAAEIGQVFLNIIVNGAHAIEEFTENGKRGLGEITLRTSQVGNSVHIRIQDTGGGIPPEIQDRVFESFFTTKKRGKGTGQGLAIAHRVVVDRHQGTLSFEAEKGVGTTFIIELPLG
ncbi:MAG: response regulator [Desulfoprunum sp.]|nr:response regulator [Desulfoprunum sp.]